MIGSITSLNRFPVTQINKDINSPIVLQGVHGNGAAFSTLINASNVNIGSITKSFNFFYKLRFISVAATSHDLDIRMQVAFNPSLSTVYSDVRHYVERGTTIVVPYFDSVIGNSGDARVNVMGVYDPVTKAQINTTTTPTTVTGTVSFHSGIELADKDVTCDALLNFIGDSITVAETGITLKQDAWTWQTRYKLRAGSNRIRMVLNAVSGTTTAQHLIRLKQGEYDTPGSKLINILLGTNNAAQAGTAIAYTNDMREIVSYLRAMNPDAIIVMCGATPTDNNTWHALLEQYRAANVALETEFADPKIKSLNLGDSFDRTQSATYYASSDSTGSKIHLNVAGNLAVATNWWTKFTAFNF